MEKHPEHFSKGKFHNLTPTPVMAENVLYAKVLRDYFNRPKSTVPAHNIPSVQTDLNNIHSATPVIVWFGHSSYLIHLDGINILVDPVFSGHASPISSMVRSFPGANGYAAADMPPLDIIVITHNHYDHLDKKTIGQLIPKTKFFYTALGTGKYLEHFGVKKNVIVELDWWQTKKFSDDLSLTATPARHFSGRGLVRGGSLWASFVLKIKGYSLFIGGDSGYDDQFKAIGQQYGPFDIAFLECGQYNTSWPFIHMMPEETVQASIDLQAKWLMPVHWGKFTLAIHPWNEPAIRATESAEKNRVKITTPMIGEPVILNQCYPSAKWWQKLN